MRDFICPKHANPFPLCNQCAGEYILLETAQLRSAYDQLRAENADLRAKLERAEEALEWIASGPTHGPGAPKYYAQASMHSECAREALQAIREGK